MCEPVPAGPVNSRELEGLPSAKEGVGGRVKERGPAVLLIQTPRLQKQDGKSSTPMTPRAPQPSCLVAPGSALLLCENPPPLIPPQGSAIANPCCHSVKHPQIVPKLCPSLPFGSVLFCPANLPQGTQDHSSPLPHPALSSLLL